MLTCLLLAVLTGHSLAQSITVKGTVTDQSTNEAIPFVTVFIKGTNFGSTTDFDGNYSFTADKYYDSVSVSYVGYMTTSLPMQRKKAQTLNFTMKEKTEVLKGVVITYKEYENPAWKILRRINKNKKFNDKSALDAYEYENYIRTVINLDDIDDDFKKKKIVQDIMTVVDRMEYDPAQDGKPMIPIFVAEELSQYYYSKKSGNSRRDVEANRVTGVGVKEGGGTFVKDLIGNSFLDCNFYDNWIRIMDRDFVSPIGASWRTFYDFELLEQMSLIDGVYCYKIKFEPKREEDLAFSGTMWITDSTYALKQIDVETSKSANINYVDGIRIQQEMIQMENSSFWLPKKTRGFVHVGEGWQDFSSILIKFYSSNKDFVINKERKASFYSEVKTLEDDSVKITEESYWKAHRHDTSNTKGSNVFEVIDSIQDIPRVKRTMNTADFAINGFVDLNKVTIGTYMNMFAINDVEGPRFQLNLLTNPKFSKRVFFDTYAAFGTKDRRFKYKLDFKYLVSPKHNFSINLRRWQEIQQVGFVNDNLNMTEVSNAFFPSETFNNTTLFAAFTRWGELRRPYMDEINKAFVQFRVKKGVRMDLGFRHRSFTPLYRFGYFRNAGEPVTASQFQVSEIITQLRITTGATMDKSGKSGQISQRDIDKPIINLRYVNGMKGVLGGDFNYHKITASVEQNIRLGLLGRTRYRLIAGVIPSQLPYQLLETHLGTRGVFYNVNAFNMMNLFEFVSDRFLVLRLTHRFNGLILNRVPLIRNTNMRSLITFNMAYGSLSDQNYDIIDNSVEETNPLNPFGKDPYMEMSYGIENVFNFARVDFYYRLNYHDHEVNDLTPPIFGIRVGGSLAL